MEKKSHSIKAKKSLGQHFLTNPKIPEIMAETVDVSDNDVVLEIGPGTGILTKELLKRGARVIAVEADIRAVEVLLKMFKDEIAGGNLTLKHADIREINLSDLGLKEHKYKLIANIPYYISGMLFRMFLSSNFQPSSLVFLVQKEVAERIVRSKKESLLSLGIKAYGNPKYIKTVKKGNFKPSPKVDSAVIEISNISHERFKKVPEDFFFEVLRVGFSAKRKQLLGNLSKLFDRKTLVHIFQHFLYKSPHVEKI